MTKEQLPFPSTFTETYKGISFRNLLCACDSISNLEFQFLSFELKGMSPDKLNQLGHALLSEILKTATLELIFQKITKPYISLGTWLDNYKDLERKGLKQIDDVLDGTEKELTVKDLIDIFNLNYTLYDNLDANSNS